jgi:hypothetical protein
MRLLDTATFTIGVESATDDELEAAAAAFVSTLHRHGLTPEQAFDAWRAMDAWQATRFAEHEDPGLAWRGVMTVAREALVAAMRAAGAEDQGRRFMIQSCRRCP